MLVAGSFEYSFHLELAISELEKRGIAGESIAAILMDSRIKERKILDSIHQADGISSFDAAALLGTFFMLAGAIYGFILEWGPIIWGLIGLLAGGIVGLLGDIFISNLKLRNGQPVMKGKAAKSGDAASQVLIIVECNNEQVPMVKEVLWDNLALGVGTLPA